MNRANDIKIRTVNLFSSIQSLVNGQITLYLIPEQTLQKNIDGIVGILQSKYPYFPILSLDAKRSKYQDEYTPDTHTKIHPVRRRWY